MPEKSLQVTRLRLVTWKDFSGIRDLEKPILALPLHRIGPFRLCLNFTCRTIKFHNFHHPNKDIEEGLEGKDIGILVNNVGVAYDEIQYFHTLSEEKILNMILVNIAAMTLMTKMILPKMEAKVCHKK